MFGNVLDPEKVWPLVSLGDQPIISIEGQKFTHVFLGSHLLEQLGGFGQLADNGTSTNQPSLRLGGDCLLHKVGINCTAI